MNDARFVLDTNLIISAALLEKSVAYQAFAKALLNGSLLISDALQEELSKVILRPKFDRYVSEAKRLRFLAQFLSLAKSVSIIEKIEVCRDPKDNMILELAVSGRANCIVTGDKDLLVLNPFREIVILSPRTFLNEYELDV